MTGEGSRITLTNNEPKDTILYFIINSLENRGILLNYKKN